MISSEDVVNFSWLSNKISVCLTKEAHERSAGPGEGTEVRLMRWSDFIAYVLEQPVVVPQAWLDPSRQDKRKVLPAKLKGYSLAQYKHRHRQESNITCLYAIGLDVDETAMTREQLTSVLQKIGRACFWHTTLSDAPGRPRYRVIFPLKEPCTLAQIEDWKHTRNLIAAQLEKKGAKCDDCAASVCRFWYWPACLLRRDYDFGVINGSLVTLVTAPPEEPIPSTQPQERHEAFAYDAAYDGDDGKYGIQWVHTQCADYLQVPKGQRHHWILKKAHFLGGLYASRSFQSTISKWMIIDTVHAYVMRNSSATPQVESRKIVDAFNAGELKPLESKKKEPGAKKTTVGKKEVHKEPERHQNEWEIKLLKKEGGLVKNMQVNINLILKYHPDLEGIFQFDVYADEILVLKPIPGDQSSELIQKFPRVLRDCDYGALTAWVETNYNFSPRDAYCVHGIRQQAQQNAIHPIKNYLNSLHSASKEDLLSTYLIRLFGAEDTPYTRAVSRKFLISAVARIDQPGCKVDTMLILEGDQGIRKSTALSILFGGHFSDNLSDIHTKDACCDLKGHWCVEVSELSKFKHADTEALKAFVSRQVDKFRPAYAREIVQRPRQGILVGTTNKAQYLADETGARRFWPVTCGEIDAEQLRRERDDLWAQAVAAYRSGEIWWMDTKELQDHAKEAQEQRQESDPWLERIASYLFDKSEITVDQVATHALSLEIARRTKADSNRISSCLRLIGWNRYKTHEKGINIYKWRSPHQAR